MISTGRTIRAARFAPDSTSSARIAVHPVCPPPSCMLPSRLEQGVVEGWSVKTVKNLEIFLCCHPVAMGAGGVTARRWGARQRLVVLYGPHALGRLDRAPTHPTCTFSNHDKHRPDDKGGAFSARFHVFCSNRCPSCLPTPLLHASLAPRAGCGGGVECQNCQKPGKNFMLPSGGNGRRGRNGTQMGGKAAPHVALRAARRRPP
jgi:hypothetical protein